MLQNIKEKITIALALSWCEQCFGYLDHLGATYTHLGAGVNHPGAIYNHPGTSDWFSLRADGLSFA